MYHISIGIDPNFRRFGISASYLRNEKPTAFLTSNPKDDKATFSFSETYERSLQQVDYVFEIITKVTEHSNTPVEETKILLFMEIPPPVAQFSAGMYLLTGLLYDRLKDVFPMKLLYPTRIKSLLCIKNRKKMKKDSVSLAKEILSLNPDVDVYKRSSRINHDEAEAFLFSVLCCNNFGDFQYKLPKRLDSKRWLMERWD